MEKLMTTIFNCETGEIIEREMNADEKAQLNIYHANAKAQKDAEATKAAEKAELLAKLGITEDEAQLLLGGN
jgi:DNA-binding Xre family transcriptional regulator